MANILLVDDDVGLRGTLKKILETNNHNVTVAGEFNGLEEAMKKENFEVIIMDIILPGLNGIEILKRIKDDYSNIPVIMITGEPNVDTAIESLRYGAYDYISKPITKHNLPPIVHKAIRQKKLIDEKNRLQKENLEYQKNLEQKVSDRTKQIKHLLTELKNAQEELMLSERLATLGTSMAYISHELKNPLSVIQNATYYINSQIDKNPQNPKIKKHLNIISKEVYIAEDFITDLLKFTRKRELKFFITHINELLENTLDLLKIPKNIKITKEYENNLPSPKIDKDQIQEVFINIINNAIVAMIDGGQLLIKTQKSDKHIEIIISDTGIGIPKENLKKIFTPFFTTKDHGTGLGLSICLFILKNHDGDLNVESSYNEGSSFIIRIPF